MTTKRFLVPTAVMACMVAGLMHHARSAAPSDPLFTFTADDSRSAHLTVDCTKRAPAPVSRLLYGKFAEHLGRNIYHGMWSQLVHNPGFAPASMWGKGAGSAARSLAFRMGMQPGSFVLQPELPPGWFSIGVKGSGARFKTVSDQLTDRPCLRIDVDQGSPDAAGIFQLVDLPLSRQRTYQWSAHVRTDRPSRVTVRLTSQSNPACAATVDAPAAPGKWQRLQGTLRLPAVQSQSTSFRFSLQLGGPVTAWLDDCQLFPADHLSGWDPDVVRLTRDSRLPLLRWPGGNFVSGYHWRDGIGPQEQRPMRLNRPWNMPESNYVGTDEFAQFCKLAGCEPMICINAGDGTAEEAADWVEYCNGTASTPMGKLRAANGHPEPYAIRYWEIGNELYGRWQIGHCEAPEYANRYRKFVTAMRRRDPQIRFIANGHTLAWNQALVDRCSDILQRVSVHILIGGGMPRQTPADKVWWAIAGYPWEFRKQLEQLSDQLRRRAPAATLAITELQIFTNRPGMPNNGGLAEALFWAGMVNRTIRAGDRVELITHSALLNHGGGLRKQREHVYPNPVCLARRLYSCQPGRWPVATHITGPAFSTPRLHNLPAVTGAPIVDGVALATDKTDQLALLLLNYDATDARACELQLKQFSPGPTAKWQWIDGADILAANSLDHPDAVRINDKELRIAGPTFAVTLPPHSLSVITLSAQ